MTMLQEEGDRLRERVESFEQRLHSLEVQREAVSTAVKEPSVDVRAWKLWRDEVESKIGMEQRFDELTRAVARLPNLEAQARSTLFSPSQEQPATFDAGSALPEFLRTA